MKIKLLFIALVVSFSFSAIAENPQPLTPVQLQNIERTSANNQTNLSELRNTKHKTKEYRNLLSGVLDSTYTWLWDTIGNVWNMPVKILYTYDVNNNRTLAVHQYLDTLVWKNLTQDIYSFMRMITLLCNLISTGTALLGTMYCKIH